MINDKKELKEYLEADKKRWEGQADNLHSTTIFGSMRFY